MFVVDIIAIVKNFFLRRIHCSCFSSLTTPPTDVIVHHAIISMIFILPIVPQLLWIIFLFMRLFLLLLFHFMLFVVDLINGELSIVFIYSYFGFHIGNAVVVIAVSILVFTFTLTNLLMLF